MIENTSVPNHHADHPGFLRPERPRRRAQHGRRPRGRRPSGGAAERHRAGRCRARRRLRSRRRGPPRGPSRRERHRRRSRAGHVARRAAAHATFRTRALRRRCRRSAAGGGRLRISRVVASPPCITGPTSTPGCERHAECSAAADVWSPSNAGPRRAPRSSPVTVGPTRKPKRSRTGAANMASSMFGSSGTPPAADRH